MSVSSTKSVYIVPIPRTPGVQVFNPSIVGRWHIADQLTGDATGGTYNFSALVGDARAMFGVHTLIDINYCNCYLLGAGATGLNWYFDSYERSTGGLFNPPLGWHTAQAAYPSNIDTIAPSFKFKVSEEAASSSLIRVVLTPNVNGTPAVFCAAGYFYDERLL